jgi:hypothetical protein
MKPIQIFVEGKPIDGKKGKPVHSTDSVFLRDCAQHWFNQKLELTVNFFLIGGAGQIKDTAQQIREADYKNHVLVIVDANGDPAKRKKEIEEFRSTEKLNFDYFLFPDNTNTGEVEVLLEQIATNTALLDCYINYEKCIGRRLDIKDEIFAYIQAATGDKESAKDKNRSFLNPHFDLNHACLEPLKKFLSPYF